MRTPHILLASKNARKMLENLRGIIDPTACSLIENEIDSNVIQLFKLGEEHFNFAKSLNRSNWRQKISRFYYGAYNVRRSTMLKEDGQYSTDSSDHKKIMLPETFPNKDTYLNKFKSLRDDRNLADYSHSEDETDLVDNLIDTEQLVENFIHDAKSYLASKGITII